MAKLYFRIGADFDKVIKLREEIAKLKNELKNMDSTQTPAAFNTLNTQLVKNTKEMDNLISEAARAGATMENDFKRVFMMVKKLLILYPRKSLNKKYHT